MHLHPFVLAFLFVMLVSARLIRFLELRSGGGSVSILHMSSQIQRKQQIFLFHRATWLVSGETHLARMGKTVKGLVSHCC